MLGFFICSDFCYCVFFFVFFWSEILTSSFFLCITSVLYELDCCFFVSAYNHGRSLLHREWRGEVGGGGWGGGGLYWVLFFFGVDLLFDYMQYDFFFLWCSLLLYDFLLLYAISYFIWGYFSPFPLEV